VDSSTSSTTNIQIGMFADSNGNPGTSLIIPSSLNGCTPGAWNGFMFPGINITAGTTYWLGVLGLNGPVFFRDDDTDGSCQSQTSSPSDDVTNIESYPGAANYWNSCNISMYVQ
jgi:hypothetical protein